MGSTAAASHASRAAQHSSRASWAATRASRVGLAPGPAAREGASETRKNGAFARLERWSGGRFHSTIVLLLPAPTAAARLATRSIALSQATQRSIVSREAAVTAHTHIKSCRGDESMEGAGRARRVEARTPRPRLQLLQSATATLRAY